MQRKTLIVIPTYDEKDNVGRIAKSVFDAAPEVEILFVDDESPDGTGAVLDAMSAEDGRVHVLHHGAKAGLGRAYVDGFRWGLDRGYERLFEMDADHSHDPR
jgi:dolichol-phosphate mannosyltransferase